jgi:uncharacterized protein (TIGR03067 family)
MKMGLVGIVLVLGLQDAGPDAAKQDLETQQGVWAVVSSRRGGSDADTNIVATIRRAVEGDHVVWTRSGKRFAGTTIVLDPKAKPAAIDVIPDGGPSRGERVLGIYKLEGDELTICMADAGKPRPVKFSAENDEPQTLMVFQREKKPEK